MASTYTLVYGDRDYRIDEASAGLITKWNGIQKAVTVALDGGSELTVVLSPGVPIAVVRSAPTA